MSQIKNVTINLTDKQRSALKQITGQEHDAVVFESNPIALTARLAPKKITPKKITPKKIAPKKIAPKKIAPKKITPKKIAPKKITPRVW